MATGEVVDLGHDNSLSAADINNAIVLFLRMVDYANYLIKIMNSGVYDYLDLILNVNVDNLNYVVYATRGVMKLFWLGQTGHLVYACPEEKGGNWI